MVGMFTLMNNVVVHQLLDYFGFAALAKHFSGTFASSSNKFTDMCVSISKYQCISELFRSSDAGGKAKITDGSFIASISHII
jgi:hypothetical protein